MKQSFWFVSGFHFQPEVLNHWVHFHFYNSCVQQFCPNFRYPTSGRTSVVIGPMNAPWNYMRTLVVKLWIRGQLGSEMTESILLDIIVQKPMQLLDQSLAGPQISLKLSIFSIYCIGHVLLKPRIKNLNFQVQIFLTKFEIHQYERIVSTLEISRE